MIRNLIFDVGDVLVEYRWFEMLTRDYGLSEAEAKRIGEEMFDNEIWVQGLDGGRLSLEEAIHQYELKYPDDVDVMGWFLRNGEQMAVKRPEVWDKVAALKEKGYKVLAVDMDPQGNMTSGLGVDKNNVENTVYDLIIGESSINEVIVRDVLENLDIIPTSIDLSGAEIELLDVDEKEYIIRNAIANIKEDYDYIVIDCPPSLSMLTINAMTTADSVLVPIQCEYYALEGLSQLIHTVELVRDRLNPQLTIEGVVFTMYDARTNLSLQVVENVKDNLDQTIYKTIIPRNIRLAEAPSYGMPINKYDPKSAGADSYMRLADEVMEKE